MEVLVLCIYSEEMCFQLKHIMLLYWSILSLDSELTAKKTVCILPQNFPLAFVVVEYIRVCEGILHDATLLLAANIHMITSGMLFWG